MNWRSAGPSLVLAATLMLAACTTPAPHQADSIAGRMSLQVEAMAPDPARQLSAGFELRGNGERGELDLAGPLGALVARARWAPGLAELETPQGTTAYRDLDDLSGRTFGEALPMAALFDWLRGRPWPGAPSLPLQGGPGFEQLGWQVDTGRLTEGQLVARRLAAPVVTLRARLETPP